MTATNGAGQATQSKTKASKPPAKRRGRPPLPPEERRAFERTSIKVDPDLMDRLRDAAYWTPGATLGRLFEEGAEMILEALEKERGEPFPPRGRKKLISRPRD